MRQRIFVALCVAAGAAAIAYAQAQPMPAPDRMGGPDPAMHAPMTRADAEKKVAERFAAIDLNHDGVVTRDEMAAAARTERDKMHAFFEARLKEHRDRAFDRLDANKDGSISREEFAAGLARDGRRPDAAPPPAAAPEPSRRMAEGGPQRFHGPMMMMHHAMLGEHWFEKADTNRDNKVTLAEAKAAALARFDALDTNHDGTIEPEERRMAFRGPWHDRRGEPLPAPRALPRSES